ncbi:Ribonucleoside-diphosphate reductase 1 subunit alpha [Bdellovibrio bacteriovorus]|uniref:ribonucleoside-diphosphate reductase subunit alpha n=1 Tax=Bdellovibrio bacteriovorus TaxID=959 RepID=UPI00045C0931|nr:ribonucleoside-diphosphate reductase subunit alpha [Bdellovibrio bacteriovorus]AHZ84480.1 ribonucleoside-diphosphate reductase [Bdellovibrio bacteriovorus]BEV68369.1 Ribonucleoside-diphosphate reductase 1 subunit alpha [Bdellovibrio bacteriovorus]
MLETTAHIMRVKKRDGTLEPVDVTKIVERVTKNCQGLTQVDPLRVATKAISGLYDGASTKELDNLCIQTASLLIGEDPEYSRLAARLLSTYIDEEVRSQKIQSFADSVSFGFQAGLLAEGTYKFVEANKAALCAAIEPYRTDRFEYFGLRTVYDRYLLKNPTTRQVFETPQYFFMRVACGLAQSVEEAVEFYRLISSHDYMPSTPTLFNSGTMRPQMSSCYLLDSPSDDLSAIYQKYTDIALLSKFAGGIGVAYSRVRSRGSLIKGTNGHSNGIIPWLKTMDSSVAAVNQGGKRKGAACVYLETWHGDIEEFLELRDNTGDEAKRAHNLNLANWVPDLFMKRVEADAMWSLFDPKVVPHFVDTYGEEFEKAYVEAEEKKLYIKQLKARDLYSRMMKTLAQTGNGWMTFKDHANLKANQTGEAGNVIHLSNLCTEILEVTSDKETAVCNLGSVNLSRHVENGQFNFEKLARSVRTAVKYLDRVVDINFYPIPTAQDSNHKWRPVGLGVMGLQDALFLMKLPFDSAAARDLSARIQEEIYYNALVTSCELAEKLGPHGAYEQTKAAKGLLQYDLWGVTPSQPERFEKLKEKIKKHGLRNSLMIAIAPTATIASIVGCYEAIEPQVSNLFKRETLSGEFMQINKYLVSDLKAMGIWTEEVRNEIKLQDGSIQDVAMIPPQIKELYRTVWEIPMKSLVDMAADRGAYIDQAQSLNLFQESPTIGKLSSMYMYAWKKGVKTTYYLRSRPATKIAKTTVKASSNSANPTASESMMDAAPAQEAKKSYSDAEVIACSLENPEACEACQ